MKLNFCLFTILIISLTKTSSASPFNKNKSIGKAKTYKFDYSLFKNKTTTRKKRSLPPQFLENVIIENVEAKFSWDEYLSGDRIGTSFILRKGNRFVENAVLYYPRDESFVVRNLQDASGYQGELRVVKDKSALDGWNNSSRKDTTFFRFDSARIVSENESKTILNTLSAKRETGLKIQSVSISLKLPKQKDNMMLEVLDLARNSSSKMVVHVFPNTETVVLNDLPSQSIVRLALKPFGVGTKEISSAFLFTGRLTLEHVKFEGSASTNYERIRPNGKKRLTVTCFVENKKPFQGFPCKGSSICIPLNWECDGDNDCQDGFDEQDCKRGLSEYNLSNYNSDNCRRNEFECFSRGVHVCLPISWLCDGRTDCSDGWDEDKRNCPDHHHYPSYSQNQNNHYHYSSSCSYNYFKCNKGGCVAPRHVCDGHKDCTDGSDEFYCTDEEPFDLDEDSDTFCDPDYEYLCGKGKRQKCVPRPWVCDDEEDCPGGEDEDGKMCSNYFPNYD